MKIARQISTIVVLGALALITTCAAEPVKQEPIAQEPVAQPAPQVKEQPKPVVKKREYIPMEK